MTDYTIIFDGGSRGNPGQGYGSYALRRNSDGKLRKRRLRFGDQVTSNQAEYQTLVAALEDLIGTIQKAGRSPRDFSVEIRGDSKLIMHQLDGTWKTKSLNLMPLRDRVEELMAHLGSAELTWQRRDESVKILGH
ncbi:MAG TPA: ribonuclease HI family protein [Anaerolineae bacterium]|nr:ribonuclease HI family protein [Anaerolineae bacterium]